MIHASLKDSPPPLRMSLVLPPGSSLLVSAEPAASANTWYYMVREVDPTRRRYSAIIVPYGIGYEPNSADPLRISMTAPLLRYGDASILPLVFNDGLAGSGHLSPAYCEARRTRTMLSIFFRILWRESRTFNRLTKRIPDRSTKGGITIWWEHLTTHRQDR